MGKFGGGAVQSKCGLVGPCILSRSHEIKGHVLAGIASKSKASKRCNGGCSRDHVNVQISSPGIANKSLFPSVCDGGFGVTALE
jgi:hypothetical protein